MKRIARLTCLMALVCSTPILASYTKADGQVCYSEAELKDCDKYKAEGNVHHEQNATVICADKWTFSAPIAVDVLPGYAIGQDEVFGMGITPRISIRPNNPPIDIDFGVSFLGSPEGDSELLCLSDTCRPVETGRSLTIVPSIELVFGRLRRVHPSLITGAGVLYEGGATTFVHGLGKVETMPTVSPVVTYGAATNFRIRRTVLLRLELRGVTALRGDRTIRLSREEAKIRLDGDNSTVAIIGLGVEFVIP